MRKKVSENSVLFCRNLQLGTQFLVFGLVYRILDLIFSLQAFSFLTKVLAIKHVFEIDSWTRGNLMASSLGIFGDADYDVCRILTTGSFKHKLFGWFEHVKNLMV
ncbi:hypothetical protein RCL_jg10187.t1 [Rhizophagus clarus]|uniref:Uncharacterized protein n=1 Tax=Rhizophagus clarus TaxID=94130 RepID=A0A8H3KWC4_9GLOM|nr:hypothetical protein RCL_jg10187.t1 [Rhizophagus clarus]